MKRIRLNGLSIVNFKGIVKYTLPLNGKSVTVTGENESKKTTIKDALNWLLFDKSSDGKPSSGKGHFGLRPHDTTGKDIRSLTVSVEAIMVFDGTAHVLRKEQTEKMTKGVITGYPNHV